MCRAFLTLWLCMCAALALSPPAGAEDYFVLPAEAERQPLADGTGRPALQASVIALEVILKAVGEIRNRQA